MIRPLPFRVRAAQPADILALMRLKHLLALGEDSLPALRATAFDWLRDGFGPTRGFTAFVAEVGNVIGMATCSQRIITGWNGPVVFLQDHFVERAYREHGTAQALTGFQPVSQCLTYVLAGPALKALADRDQETLARAG